MDIRKATTVDKDAVLALNKNVFGGLDYLPSYYDDFLENPIAMPFIITLDGEIIGYLCAFVVDNGETVVHRAGRISPKFQGKGFYKVLSQHVNEKVRERYNLKTRAMMTGDGNLKTQTDSFRQTNTLILQRDLVKYMVLPSHLKEFSGLLNTLPNKNVSVLEVKAYFDTEAIRKYLFPQDRMIVGLVPYRLLSSNLALLDKKNIVCVSDVKVDDEIVSGLLSIATFYKVSRPGYAYVLELYGTDMNSVRYHLLSHLDFIAKTLDDVVYILFFVDKQCQQEKISDVSAECGLVNWIDSDYKTTLECLFESNL
ncbi:hypothetical protein CHS0354_037530 [Potamilus streckersoni]|uniref:N-acetyltransferase domain-containing protein n=1 Tax=Potamilus streckersoni TaxID=2493646 RepID=A0AAE0RPL9_9BIVA|nr:hypothetical protein CHS0354_037530 [Potamilus streckersoni]